MKQNFFQSRSHKSMNRRPQPELSFREDNYSAFFSKVFVDLHLAL